jgi:hypothetical protein
MTSEKVIKSMSKYQERNYAPKERKIEKSDLGKYKNRDARWQAPETSYCDCILESWEITEEEVG